MTVITKPINGQKEEKAFLPDPESSPADVVLPPATAPPAHRRLRLLTQLSLSLVFTLGLVIVFFALGHVVRQMYHQRFYRGYCRIPLSRSMDDSLITGDFSDNNRFANGGLVPVHKAQVTGESLTLMEKIKADGSVEFDYELDLDLEEYEEFQMPELSRGRYFHDFKVNQTAIIDPDGKRCFLLPLDRDEIPKPKTLLDLIVNLRNGAYNMDIDEIREDTVVVLPPITDLSGYGLFIPTACEDMISYKLRRLTEEEQEESFEIVKRSVQSVGKDFDFIEFTGKKYIKYNIVNLADIE